MKINGNIRWHSLTNMKCQKKNYKFLMKLPTGGTHSVSRTQSKILTYGSMKYITFEVQ